MRDEPENTEVTAQGAAEKLREYWTEGPGGAEIGWGTPGDFTRCVTRLSRHMSKDQAEGYCANLHRSETGKWPGEK